MVPSLRYSRLCYLTGNINAAAAATTEQDIEDRTSTNLVNLRRVIYLTIMNALSYEEAVHKLLKVQLAEGEEVCFGAAYCRAQMLIFFFCLSD